MAKRATYHVVPHKDGDWRIQREGATRASSLAPTQTEAVERARELAQKNPLGQVVIHRRDGRIREEHTYGEDPYPPEG